LYVNRTNRQRILRSIDNSVRYIIFFEDTHHKKLSHRKQIVSQDVVRNSLNYVDHSSLQLLINVLQRLWDYEI